VFVAAASGDFPLQGIIWTILMFFGLALVVWLLITVLSDVFRREGMSTLERVAWTVGVFLFPILGSLVYLITRGRDVGDAGFGSTSLRMNSYERTVTGDGQYHGLRDEAADHRAMSGPVRPS
jgi:hypothetical protein